MNPLFEELLAAQAPGYTPAMPVAPTAASTGGTVEQPLTPAGQVVGGGILHGLMFPGMVAKGDAQVFDDQGHVTKEATDWGVERALGMLRTANIPRTPVAPNEVAFGSGPIRAYHGSPHDFDRFDLSKIGTGEGAQVYGHGLYFAEQEATAKAYRDALSAKKPLWDKAGERWIAPDNPYYDDFVKMQGSPGRMYEVAIHADPERFLDWDKPLTQQPHAERLVGRHLERALDQPGPLMDDVFRRFENGQMTGADAYKTFGNQTAASAALNEAGIPGIKYLDQGSRTAGDGSRNYVTFSDKIVEIMRKYGVASFAALPPAVQMMLQRGQTETPASNGGLGGLGGLAPRA